MQATTNTVIATIWQGCFYAGQFRS